MLPIYKVSNLKIPLHMMLLNILQPGKQNSKVALMISSKEPLAYVNSLIFVRFYLHQLVISNPTTQILLKSVQIQSFKFLEVVKLGQNGYELFLKDSSFSSPLVRFETRQQFGTSCSWSAEVVMFWFVLRLLFWIIRSL